jgi:ubiquinone/menaquinone biosynthesis C-methylase UbiE
MTQSREYILGHSADAARRLAIQDAHFGDTSEKLLDDLPICPGDRVVELGCGPGSFSKRILQRLGPGGVLIGVDASQGLLKQADAMLADRRFQPTLADITTLGTWLDGADVVIGRAVLHHVPMAEFLLGRLRARLKAGTRVGFIEPDFRSPLARLAYLQATGRPELAPLGIWATAINNLYLANRISPDVGATLAQTLRTAGYANVRGDWSECRSDGLMIENMLMFYDEVRDRLATLGIMTAAEVTEQQRLLRELAPEKLPAAWGIFRVASEVPLAA